MAIDLNELATAISQLTLRFRLRRRPASVWASTNEVLLASELGHEQDTGRLKLGDGSTAWGSLPYMPRGKVVTIQAGASITVDNTDPENPVIASTGGSGSTWPLPDGVIGWYSITHRTKTSGTQITFMNPPIDGGPMRGCFATPYTGSPAFTSTGHVPAGGQFVTSFKPICNPITIMAVVTTPAAIANGTYGTVVGGSGGSSLQMRMQGNTSGYFITMIKAQVAGIGDDSAYTAMAVNTKYLVTFTLNASGAWVIRRNGTQTSSGTTTNFPTTANDAIGYSVGGTETSIGFLDEVVYFDSALTGTNLTTAETYFKTKHGL